jgi:hypothetical protein
MLSKSARLKFKKDCEITHCIDRDFIMIMTQKEKRQAAL